MSRKMILERPVCREVLATRCQEILVLVSRAEMASRVVESFCVSWEGRKEGRKGRRKEGDNVVASCQPAPEKIQQPWE